MVSVLDRLDFLSRAACPWCGNDRETVFIRAIPGDYTSPLICRSPHFPRHMGELERIGTPQPPSGDGK